jgi:hypothetical protein
VCMVLRRKRYHRMEVVAAPIQEMSLAHIYSVLVFLKQRERGYVTTNCLDEEAVMNGWVNQAVRYYKQDWHGQMGLLVQLWSMWNP